MITVDPSEFVARWHAWYSDAEPFGYAIGAARTGRWLRIHSLPGSRRYPATEADRQEVLSRHNAAAALILGHDPAVLVGYDDEGRLELPAAHPLRPWLPDASPVARIALDDDGEASVSVFAGPVRWSGGMLDQPFLMVAEDAMRLMLVNWRTGAVYAPYDGGADLYFATPEDRDRARERFAAWLSPDPSGL